MLNVKLWRELKTLSHSLRESRRGFSKNSLSAWLALWVQRLPSYIDTQPPNLGTFSIAVFSSQCMPHHGAGQLEYDGPHDVQVKSSDQLTPTVGVSASRLNAVPILHSVLWRSSEPMGTLHLAHAGYRLLANLGMKQVLYCALGFVGQDSRLPG